LTPAFAMTIMTRMTRTSISRTKQVKESRTWAVAKAKARLSAVIDRALSEGPQTITRSGHKAVIVVSAEEWERKTRRKGNLAEFLAASPLRGSRIRIKRSSDRPRHISL
jgi:prevent-host-death family protein